MGSWTITKDGNVIIKKEDIPKSIKSLKKIGVNELKKVAPVRSSKLKDSIRARDDGEQVEFYSKILYAPYVLYGTGIYGSRGAPITPVRASCLHWVENGQDYFAKSVRGQKPNRFPKKALENIKYEMAKILSK